MGEPFETSERIVKPDDGVSWEVKCIEYGRPVIMFHDSPNFYVGDYYLVPTGLTALQQYDVFRANGPGSAYLRIARIMVCGGELVARVPDIGGVTAYEAKTADGCEFDTAERWHHLFAAIDAIDAKTKEAKP